MEEGFIKGLVDFGALGLFILFLIWRDMKSQKRIDDMIKKFHDQALEIARQEVRREEIHTDMARTLGDHTLSLESIEDGIQDLQGRG